LVLVKELYQEESNTLSRISRYSVGVLALCALLAQPAIAETYSIDPVHSSVGFSIRHLVGRTSGSFADFSGSIAYDEAKPSAASFAGTVQIGSIDTGNEKRDGHLKSADFFDAEKFPIMGFSSTSVKSTKAGLQVTGDLTLHGVTKSIVIPVEVLGIGMNPMSKKPVAGFSAEFVIARSDFGVNSWVDQAGVVGDEVKITLLVEAGAAGE
jgi:polyisoprenoid-binding protein YceI